MRLTLRQLLLASRQAIPPAANLVDLACAHKLFNHARKIAASAVPQAHPVGDLANAGGLGKLRDVREHFLARHFLFSLRLLSGGVFPFHELEPLTIRTATIAGNRLTEFAVRGKKWFSGKVVCDQGERGVTVCESSSTILPSGSRSSSGAYKPSSSRFHHIPVSRFVFMLVNQYW